jgi:PEP-CTERM motif
MMTKNTFRCLAVAMGLIMTAATARADVFQTYDLSYSGAAFGNAATATATITLDLSLMNNPGETDQATVPFVTDFSITVSGASSGNGTFGFADYNGSGTLGGFYLTTNGGTLDFNQELIGQPTSQDPFGTVPSAGNAGDFNIFGNGNDAAAPQGTFFFQITTDGGAEDSLFLTSFRPRSVPEPSGLVLSALGLIGLAGRAGWKRMRPATS